MTILIIILAVVLIMGSALWVLPSARQRQQMAMRRAAMAKGMQVKITRIKDLEYPGEEMPCIAYRLPRQRVNDPSHHEWMLYRHSEADPELHIPGWLYDREKGRHRFSDGGAIAKILLRLPSDVKAVQATAGAVSIYWDERGDIQDLDTILQVLKALQSC
jgi:hypothetical protein